MAREYSPPSTMPYPRLLTVLGEANWLLNDFLEQEGIDPEAVANVYKLVERLAGHCGIVAAEEAEIVSLELLTAPLQEAAHDSAVA